VPATRARPWLRYWARSIDLALLLLAVVLLGVARSDSFVRTLLALYAFVPIEAALLTAFGTTPGKWLFNIFVEAKSGGRLSLAAAFRRTFGVLLYGLGMLIPIVSLLAQVISYVRLTDRGETHWDRAAGSQLRHGPITAARAVLILLVIVGIAVVLAALSYSVQSTGGADAEI
jgi:uncharacterized RDD family membrane protein YckC